MTCTTLIDRSLDARPESGDTTGVMTSTRIGKCDQSRDIQPESYLLIGVGHMTRVGHMIGVSSSDQSRAYDWSRDIPAL
jgi:hypothetical protein